MWGDGKMGKNMVKGHILGENGNVKDTSMKGNGKMGKNTVKEHGLGLMDKKM